MIFTLPLKDQSLKNNEWVETVDLIQSICFNYHIGWSTTLMGSTIITFTFPQKNLLPHKINELDNTSELIELAFTVDWIRSTVSTHSLFLSDWSLRGKVKIIIYKINYTIVSPLWRLVQSIHLYCLIHLFCEAISSFGEKWKLLLYSPWV
jgi:hypothetical protein